MADDDKLSLRKATEKVMGGRSQPKISKVYDGDIVNNTTITVLKSPTRAPNKRHCTCRLLVNSMLSILIHIMNHRTGFLHQIKLMV